MLEIKNNMQNVVPDIELTAKMINLTIELIILFSFGELRESRLLW